ncbi:MAG: hypothetical protein ACI88H_000338 [Cocleimonas sp.]|jgi:hypothetical protein
MEATYNDFSKEDILNSISLKSKAIISNCQILLNPQTSKKVSNTDIVIWINDLHKSLDNEYEVGLRVEHLGKQIIFYIDLIAHQNQSMIYFKGHTESGKLVHFVKHSSDLKIELQTLKRRVIDTAKTPFGFDDWNAFENAKKLNA